MDRSKIFLEVSGGVVRSTLLWLSGLFLFSILLAYTHQWPSVSGVDLMRRFGLQIFLLAAILHSYFAMGWRPLAAWSQKTGLKILGAGLLYCVFLKSLDLVLSFSRGETLAHRHSFTSLDQLFLSLILAPILEEIFFRDLLFRSLSIRFGKIRFAAVLSSLFFMIAHGALYPGAFLLGLISCGLILFTGSLWASILFHILSNMSWFFLPDLFPNLYRALVDFQILNWFFQ